MRSRGFRVPRERRGINHNFHFSSRPLTLTRLLRRIKFNLSAMLLERFFFLSSPFISGLWFRFAFFLLLLLETCRLERLAIVISRYGYNDTLRVISL